MACAGNADTTVTIPALTEYYYRVTTGRWGNGWGMLVGTWVAETVTKPLWCLATLRCKGGHCGVTRFSFEFGSLNYEV